MFVTHSLIFHDVSFIFYVRPRPHLPFSLENGDFSPQFGLPCENARGDGGGGGRRGGGGGYSLI